MKAIYFTTENPGVGGWVAALRPKTGRGEGSEWWILTPTGVSNFQKNDPKRVAKYENFTNSGSKQNKANLRDLIAATGLVILLKLHSNHRFFSPYNLEIWWMTSINNRELQWGNTKIGSRWTTFIAVWPWNLTDDFENQQGTSSKQHQSLCIISSSYVNSNWSYSPETAKLGSDLDLLHGHHFCHWW